MTFDGPGMRGGPGGWGRQPGSPSPPVQPSVAPYVSSMSHSAALTSWIQMQSITASLAHDIGHSLAFMLLKQMQMTSRLSGLFACIRLLKTT